MAGPRHDDTVEEDEPLRFAAVPRETVQRRSERVAVEASLRELGLED